MKLSDGHLAYFVVDSVRSLELQAFTQPIQSKDARGERPYHPAMMLSLPIYGYCVGVFSSRRIARATYDDLAFRFLSGGNHPHFSRIADFRRRHLKDFRSLFVQVVRICQQAGLVKLGHVALDGTKVKANASKHKAMTYERMQKSEARLCAEIDQLLAKAEGQDVAEDERYGFEHGGCDVPAELQRRETRLAAIRQAKQELELQAAEKRAEALRAQAAEIEADEPSNDPNENDGLSTHKAEPTAEGLPKPKAQRNFTDPESRIMESAGAFVQSYNCQLAVDEKNQIIVGQWVHLRSAQAR